MGKLNGFANALAVYLVSTGVLENSEIPLEDRVELSSIKDKLLIKLARVAILEGVIQGYHIASNKNNGPIILECLEEIKSRHLLTLEHVVRTNVVFEEFHSSRHRDNGPEDVELPN